jgi:NAD(P)-dependent dehydrogenase (short-subunit alcohol dehydrogenase family)
VSISTAEAITPALAHELRVRDITVNGLAPGLESPGADHDAGDLIALL